MGTFPFKWAAEIYYNLNLRKKLTITYLVFIVIPVAMLGVLTYNNIQKTVMEQTGAAYLEALRQTEINIGYGLSAATSIAELIQTTPSIQNVLKKVYAGEITNEEEISFFLTLQTFLKNNEGRDAINQINFYMKAGPSFIHANTNYRDMSALAQEPALHALLAGEQRYTWLYSSHLQRVPLHRSNEILLFHEVRNLSNINQVIGYIMIELDANFVWSILNELTIPEGAALVVLDEGKPIKQRSYKQETEAVVDDYMTSKEIDRQGIEMFTSAGTTYYAVSKEIELLKWNVLLLLTEEQMAANILKIRQFITIMAFIIAVLAVTIAYMISGNITKRLKRLLALFKKAEMGKFEVDLDVRGRDEYAILQRNFNQMSVTIKKLIEEVYQAKLSKQAVEMKLLYAQINPHFLYNTLDIIHWQALRIKSTEIAEITQSLANYLRLSLNGGKEMISISDEIEEVKSYMHIINYRYRGMIHFITEIDEEIKELEIIKMVLQPLIENAVIHGIRLKEGKVGTIIVRAYLEEESGDILIKVIDDGVGMTAGQLSQIMQSKSGGYGIKNVDQRIKAYYGEPYGLYYHSRPGIGCCVLVRLKK